VYYREESETYFRTGTIWPLLFSETVYPLYPRLHWTLSNKLQWQMTSRSIISALHFCSPSETHSSERIDFSCTLCANGRTRNIVLTSLAHCVQMDGLAMLYWLLLHIVCKWTDSQYCIDFSCILCANGLCMGIQPCRYVRDQRVQRASSVGAEWSILDRQLAAILNSPNRNHPHIPTIATLTQV
jgi:hypothetical protein